MVSHKSGSEWVSWEGERGAYLYRTQLPAETLNVK